MINKIVFILPTLTHPRHHKRINALKELYNVKVYAFDRGVYKVNTLSSKDSITVLGKVKNKRYWARLVHFKTIYSVIKKEKANDVLFYFFSLDIAFIGGIMLNKRSEERRVGKDSIVR